MAVAVGVGVAVSVGVDVGDGAVDVVVGLGEAVSVAGDVGDPGVGVGLSTVTDVAVGVGVGVCSGERVGVDVVPGTVAPASGVAASVWTSMNVSGWGPSCPPHPAMISIRTNAQHMAARFIGYQGEPGRTKSPARLPDRPHRQWRSQWSPEPVDAVSVLTGDSRRRKQGIPIRAWFEIFRPSR